MQNQFQYSVPPRIFRPSNGPARYYNEGSLLAYLEHNLAVNQRNLGKRFLVLILPSYL